MGDAVLRLEGVARRFQQGRGAVLEVLRGVDLAVRAGEIVALVGPSGAGKSTLLQIAGLLERPSDGQVFIAGQDCAGLSEEGRTKVRGQALGFVYQYHHLLPEFSAVENVTLPQLIDGTGSAQAKERARDLLSSLGLAERLGHRPAQLSGGEQQRVAIARALANAPKLLLADEPTGNLDPGTAGDVFALLLETVRTAGLAALIATHNPDLATRMDRTVRLEGGSLVAA